MKLIVKFPVVALLLLLPAACFGAITAGPNTGTQGHGSTLTSSSITTANNDVVFVACSSFGVTINTPTDSKSGNTWTQVGSTQTSPGSGEIALFRSVLTNGGSGHTFTCNYASAVDAGIAVQDFSGNATSNGDDGNNGGTGSSASPSSGSITPTTANDAIVGALTNDDGSPTVTQGTNFTRSYDGESTTSAQPINLEYQILSGTPATAATWTLSPSGGWAAVAGMFKPAAGGAACTPTLTLMGVGRCG